MSALAYGQTDELNLQKYWKFRSDFVEKFVKIGPNPGESQPAGLLSPGTCVDNASEWGNIEYGTMSWGDGMIRHGYYLSLLATEFALRKKYDLDLKGIQNELYYAIAVINRLDTKAEAELNSVYFSRAFYDDNLNGFYLREDVGEDFYLNWADDPMHIGCVYSAFYENNNVARVHEPDRGFIVKETTSYQNVPSLDQMSSVMVGLSLVHKLVDNVWVQPTSSDQGFKLVDEVAAIVDRMVGYASDRNWQLIDVNGWPVANGGGDLVLAAPTFLAAAERITGSKDQYSKWAVRRMQVASTVQYCLTGFGIESGSSDREKACASIDFFDLFQNKAWKGLQAAVPAGADNNQDNSEYQDWIKGGLLRMPVNSYKWLWTKTIGNAYTGLFTDLSEDGKIDALPWPLNKLMFGEDAITHYNNTIMFNLGVTSGFWTSAQVNEWANITTNRQLELSNALLHDLAPTEDKAFYQSFLNSMKPEGGYRLKGSNCCPATEEVAIFQSDAWASDYRWTHPHSDKGEGGGDGIYPGLDYMVFHNLYYLLYADSLPDFTENFHCFCDAEVQMQITRDHTEAERDARNNLNKKLSYVPTCQPDAFDAVNQRVRSTFNVGPKFSNYTELEILTTKYQRKDVLIEGGGEVNVLSNLVISDGALIIKSGGKLNTISGDVYVEENGIIGVYGDLIIGAGTKLAFGPNTKMKLMDGSRLIVEDDATVNVISNETIELSKGAKLIVNDALNEQLIRSVLKVVEF